jgi:hypothetical protein
VIHGYGASVDRKGIKFHPVKYFDEVVKIALGK